MPELADLPGVPAVANLTTVDASADQEWLTPAQVRALFPWEVPTTTLHRWADKGLLGLCKRTFGGHRRFWAPDAREAVGQIITSALPDKAVA